MQTVRVHKGEWVDAGLDSGWKPAEVVATVQMFPDGKFEESVILEAGEVYFLEYDPAVMLEVRPVNQASISFIEPPKRVLAYVTEAPSG